MLRGFAIFVGAVLLALVGLSQPPALSQSSKAQATIAALQTRVAELEQQLDLTPTPAAQDPLDGPAPSSPAVVGTAADLMPAGSPGELSIIATGAFREGSVPVVLRNNTGTDLTSLEVSGAVRDAQGLVTQTINAGSQFKPIIVHPGELVIGDIYLDQPVAEDDTVTITARGSDDLSYYERSSRKVIPLELVEFNDLGDRVTGSVANPTEKATVENGYLQVTCFDEIGFPLWTGSSYVNDGLASGDVAAFEFNIYASGPIDCGRYLFGAYSYTE